MKSKQQTPLGYLMSLLGVSLQDLGDYLYVAQTSISKWKTGARILKPDSQHFAGIVEYFTILARDGERRAKMAQLFARLYPEQPTDTPEALGESVRAFLGGKLLPSVMLQEALEGEARLYTAQVGVYGSVDGCAAAFRQALSYLAGQPPCTVYAVDRRDEGMLARLLPAARQGHQIRLLLDHPSPSLLMGGLAPLLCYDNVQVRLLPALSPLWPGEARYLIGKELLLCGAGFPGHLPYAAMYTDAITIEHHEHLLEAVWAAAVPALETIQVAQMGERLYRQAARTTLPTGTEWLVPTLPYLSMSRPLLMEVLRANDVSGRVWTHMLAAYDALEGMALRLFVPAEALQGPQMHLPLLSMLCGQQISLTQAQAVRHMLDTAAKLRAEGQLSLVPVQGEVPAAWREASVFTKRNANGGYLGLTEGTVRITHAPKLLEALAQGFDGLAQAATEEARMGGYIAGLLEAAALSGE